MKGGWQNAGIAVGACVAVAAAALLAYLWRRQLMQVSYQITLRAYACCGLGGYPCHNTIPEAGHEQMQSSTILFGQPHHQIE